MFLQQWMDPYLKWDPAYYGGLTELVVPDNLVWKPDIVLYNL